MRGLGNLWLLGSLSKKNKRYLIHGRGGDYNLFMEDEVLDQKEELYKIRWFYSDEKMEFEYDDYGRISNLKFKGLRFVTSDSTLPVD